jgi:hypothetical protein
VEISRYVQELQSQLSVAAEAGGDDAKVIAERLASTLESTARLVLLEALSEAASEITTELAPGSVDVRLRGRDPEFVVTAPPAPRFEGEPRQPDAVSDYAELPEFDGTEPVMSRTTLRLPESTKLRVEAAAAREGMSVNAWLVRAIIAALSSGSAAQSTRPARNGGNSYTGWVR